MKNRSYYKTVNLALDILESFSRYNESMSVSEIATNLGISRVSASKMLSTLAARSLVTKSEIDSKYSLGIKMLTLASFVRTELRSIAKPYLQKLCKETAETVSLFVLENNERRCLDQVEGNQEVRLRMSVGARFPLCAGSPSKVLLAHLPKHERDELLDKCALTNDDANITFNRITFEEELESVRKKGFAISIGERAANVSSVSAPIRDRTGEVIAAICIATPKIRMNSIKIKQYSGVIIQTANEISQQLGYQPSRIKNM